MQYGPTMIQREIARELVEAAGEYPVVTVFGPRQSGKTTLAQMTFPDKHYVSLEDPDVRMAAETDPLGFLSEMPHGAVLDEIQRLPQLLSYNKLPRRKQRGIRKAEVGDLHAVSGIAFLGFSRTC